MSNKRLSAKEFIAKLNESESKDLWAGRTKTDLAKLLFSKVNDLIESDETNIKVYEHALQDILEKFFPGKLWWQVCKLNIFMDLFENRDPYKTIKNIVDNIIDAETDVNLDESVSSVKNILEPLIVNGKIRPFKKDEKRPRGFAFKSGNQTSGEVSYNGTDYAWAIVDGKLRVMTSAAAGSNWSETIYSNNFKEAIKPIKESSYDNSVKYKNELKQKFADLVNDTLYDAFDNFDLVALSSITNLPTAESDGYYGTPKYWDDFIKGMTDDYFKRVNFDESLKESKSSYDFDDTLQSDRDLYNLIDSYMRDEFCKKFDLDYFIISQFSVYDNNIIPSLIKLIKQSKAYYQNESLKESKDDLINEETKLKRIANYKEFDNGHVLFDMKEMSTEDAEKQARDMSKNDPTNIYYVKFDDIMNPSSDIRWINGKAYNYEGFVSMFIREGRPYAKDKDGKIIDILDNKEIVSEKTNVDDFFINGIKEAVEDNDGAMNYIYADYTTAKEKAKENNFIEIEYGDIYNEPYSYCVWSSENVEDRKEYIIAYYKFVSGRPAPLTKSEADYLDDKFILHGFEDYDSLINESITEDIDDDIAMKAINDHESEFGADGTRVFRNIPKTYAIYSDGKFMEYVNGDEETVKDRINNYIAADEQDVDLFIMNGIDRPVYTYKLVTADNYFEDNLPKFSVDESFKFRESNNIVG